MIRALANTSLAILLYINTIHAQERPDPINDFPTQINKILSSDEYIGESWSDSYLKNETISAFISNQLKSSKPEERSRRPRPQKNETMGLEKKSIRHHNDSMIVESFKLSLSEKDFLIKLNELIDKELKNSNQLTVKEKVGCTPNIDPTNLGNIEDLELVIDETNKQYQFIDSAKESPIVQKRKRVSSTTKNATDEEAKTTRNKRPPHGHAPSKEELASTSNQASFTYVPTTVTTTQTGASQPSSQLGMGAMDSMNSQSVIGDMGSIYSQSIMGSMGSMYSQPMMGSTYSQPMMGMMGSTYSHPMMGMMGSTYSQPMMGVMGSTYSQPMMGMMGSTYSQPMMGGTASMGIISENSNFSTNSNEFTFGF